MAKTRNKNERLGYELNDEALIDYDQAVVDYSTIDSWIDTYVDPLVEIAYKLNVNETKMKKLWNESGKTLDFESFCKSYLTKLGRQYHG